MAVVGRFLITAASKVWAVIGPVLIGFVWDKFTTWLAARKAQAAIRAKAKAEREATESAETQAEREHAADVNRRL